MNNYIKPIVIKNDGYAEPVYMASGDACYSIGARIHQKPEIGRGDFRIQLDAVHSAGDGHHSTQQILTISFNVPVAYKESKGTLISGDGTNTLVIQYGYHNNASENIGLGDLVVEADANLAVTSCMLDCNHYCNQH